MADLSGVVLDPQLRSRLERAAKSARGTPSWQARKRVDAHELLALSQIASRLDVLELDLRTSLRALLHMRTPVACRRVPDGPLEIEQHALLGLTCREEALRKPMAGYSFIQVIAPRDCVWHANVSYDAVQALCLGRILPAGVRVKDLMLMAYGGLSMQTVQLDEQDPAGVLNPEAARWWQANVERLPLSGEPFLSAEID